MKTKKQNLTGVAKGTSRYNGVMMVCEYVRTDTGAVYSRHKNNGFKSKWEYRETVPLDQVSYRGNTWMTNKGLLELTNVRLPV